jgi:hypothetical protein
VFGKHNKKKGKIQWKNGAKQQQLLMKMRKRNEAQKKK